MDQSLKYGGDFSALDEALDEIEIFDETAKSEINELAKESGNIQVTTHVRKTKPGIKEEFVIAFIDNLQVLADLGLSSRQIKVMLYMLKAMEYGNIIMLSPKQMGIDLGIDKSNVSRDIKALRTKGVLIENNGHTYVNSNLFAKGIKSGMDAERRQHLTNAQANQNGSYKAAF